MSQPQRILFVERNLRNEKLGVMYLSASLKARGHHADLIQTDKEDLNDRIRDYQPHFVAFSITTGEHVFALKVARAVKERFGIPNIFGGPHCTYFPELGLDPAVDFIVQGQGERAIVDIVEGRIEPGFLKAEMAEHLDDLAFADREIFYQFPEFRDNPMKNFITSRACPYKCSYCFNHSQLALTKIDGETSRWFDRRSIENLVAEIDAVRSQYPLEKILYIDDSFIQTQAWLDRFLTGYTEQIKLPWMCSLRVNCLDENLAQRMFHSGLEMVNYAMESADPDVQQRLLHRGHISNADVIRAINLFDAHGVRARMQNMIGLPLENALEDALNTLQFNMRHRVTDSWCSIFQPYPRTALGQYCIDHRFATEDQLRHCSESFFDESRINIPNKRELYALQKLWYFAIDAQLPMDLIRVLIRGDYTLDDGDQLQKLRFQCSRKKLYGLEDADAASSVDLQSRERWNSGNHTASDHSPPDTNVLIRLILRDAAVPDQLVDILSRVTFSQDVTRDLHRYHNGEQVHDALRYTINDETGELADPSDSIFTRGVADPNNSDIRTMPEAHFMQGMAEVRETLKQPKKTMQTAAAMVQVGLPDKEDDDTLTATAMTGRDERHLNQYLA